MKRLPSSHQRRFSMTPVTLFLLGFSFLVIVFTYQIGRNLKDIHDWRAKITKEQHLYAQEETRKDDLERLERAAIDSSAMLRYLKRQFGYLQPGETLYRAPDSASLSDASRSAAPTLWQALFTGKRASP